MFYLGAWWCPPKSKEPKSKINNLLHTWISLYLPVEGSAFAGCLVGNIADGTGAKETKHWLQYRSERPRVLPEMSRKV